MLLLDKIFNRKAYDSLSEPLLKEYNLQRPLGPQKNSCYAPFKSIYFGHHGRAIACCYNRTHILGEFPKQSIHEIWFGEEAEKLRDYIKHNDFSLGCVGCKQQLLARNFDAVKAKQYDQLKLNSNHYPSVMEFELSNVCNLECEMCNGDFSSLIRAKREKLQPLEIPYDENFVDQLEEFIPHLEEVKFYGGEPFLVEIYYSIWERIRKINPAVRVSVQTNATVLNNRVKEILADTNFHINVSFDSLQKETYEHIRKNAEFERTLENLKWFREYTRERNTFFGISVCAMQQNWRELPDFIRFCNELNAPVYFHTVLFPPHCSIRSMATTEIKGVLDFLQKHNFPEETPVQKKNKKHYIDFAGQIEAWYQTAVKLKQVQSVESFADLAELLADHIAKDASLTEDKKKLRTENVRNKMKEVAELIPDDFVKNNMNRLDVNDPLVFDNMVMTIDKMPVTALVLMAKASFK